MSQSESNRCAYCLTPVTDHFVCADCLQTKNISIAKQDTKDPDPMKVFYESETLDWKTFPIHPDFGKPKSRRLVTLTLALPIGGLAFMTAGAFGIPAMLAFCLAALMAMGWYLHRKDDLLWHHYASWVLKHGKSIACEIDVVSQGQLDKPYIVVKQENQLTAIYESQIFKVIVGGVDGLFTSDAPRARASFNAVATYDKARSGDAVIFQVDDQRLWCKTYAGRGI